MYAQTQDPKWEDKLEVAGYGKDHVIFVSLQLLPLILSPGSMMSRSGKKVRATTLEALRGFVEVKPVGTNIPQFIDEIVENRNRKQPFVLILGDRKQPCQSFVIVEGTALPAADIMEAVDICFKSFYVLDISYPSQCSSSWEFIQQYVFKLAEGKGKGLTSPSVRSLRAYLNRM